MSYLKAGLATQEQVTEMMQKRKVFDSFDFRLRTDDFYNTVAEEMVTIDTKCERKKYGYQKKKYTKNSSRKRIKALSSGESPKCSFDVSCKTILNFIQPIKMPKIKKTKKKKEDFNQVFKMRKLRLNKVKKIIQIKRLFGDKYALSPEMEENELDGLLDSGVKSN